MRTLLYTGQDARDLRWLVDHYWRKTAPWTWTEVQQSDCKYGCKIYGRRIGCIYQFVIFHNRTYGCKTHGSEKVSVRPKG